MMRQTMTFDEYKKRVDAFWDLLKNEILIDANGDEIYRVFSVIRSDMEDKIQPCGMIFRKIESIRDFIEYTEDNLLPDFATEDNEEVKDFAYWKIQKFRITDGEYRRLFSLCQVNQSGFLAIEFGGNFEKYATDAEKIFYKEWLDISELELRNTDLVLPFKAGDVLKIDNRPFSEKNDYYILHKNQMVFMRDYWDNLTYGSIFYNAVWSGYGCFLPCHITKVPCCPDEALGRLSAIIRDGDEVKVQRMIKKLSEEKALLDKIRLAQEIEDEILEEKPQKTEAFKERITLEEYKDIREAACSAFMSIFVRKPQDDELYFLKSKTSQRFIEGRDGMQELFRDFDKMIEYAVEESPYVYPDWEDEDAYEKSTYWTAEKRKLVNGSYQTTMYCLLGSRGNVLEFMPGEAFYEGCKNDENFERLSRQLKLVNYSGGFSLKLPEIDFPFQPGDILFADKSPAGEEQECVYLGGARDKAGVSYYCLNHVNRRALNRFHVGSLKTMGDFAADRQPCFHLIEKRDIAADPFLNKASKAIKRNKGCAERIIEMGRQVKISGPDEIDEYFDSVLGGKG